MGMWGQELSSAGRAAEEGPWAQAPTPISEPAQSQLLGWWWVVDVLARRASYSQGQSKENPVQTAEDFYGFTCLVNTV